MRLKYIIFDHYGLEYPVIFPELIEHDRMAQKVKECDTPSKPISAGFIKIKQDLEYSGLSYIECYGNSTSLNLESKKEIDSEFIKNFLKGEWDVWKTKRKVNEICL